MKGYRTTMDKVIDSVQDLCLDELNFPIITAFYSPNDYPKRFVARVFDGNKPTNAIMIKDCFEEIRRDIRQHTNMFFFPRDGKDHPSVIGTWM